MQRNGATTICGNTMSNIVNRALAISDFRDFVADHLASRAGHVGYHFTDPPEVDSVDVGRSETMNVFLKLHPEHTKFSDAVSQVMARQSSFSFSRVRWEIAAGTPSADG